MRIPQTLMSIPEQNKRNWSVVRIWRYADTYYKVSWNKSIAVAGMEDREPQEATRTRNVNSAKLDNNLSRAKSAVLSKALCNPWDYFVTLTLDASKVDRYALHDTYRHLAKWLCNLRNRRYKTLRYLIVPEPHKDGAWHFHGLLGGLPLEDLRPFDPSERIPDRVRALVLSGRQIYDWPRYREAYGWVTCEPIRDPVASACYMTKYITKSLGSDAVERGYHLYYCSTGLVGPELVVETTAPGIYNPDYVGDYCTVKVCHSLSEACASVLTLDDITTWED